MSLARQRIYWDDGKPSVDPEDYRVVDKDRDKPIGRIYRPKTAAMVACRFRSSP